MEGKIFVFWNWVAEASAPAFFISALAHFLGEEKYRNITRLGAFIAAFPLLIEIF